MKYNNKMTTKKNENNETFWKPTNNKTCNQRKCNHK